MRQISGVALCVGLIACTDATRLPAASSPAPAAAPAPTVVVDTPDRALKSYWEMRDAFNRRNREVLERHREEFGSVEQLLAQVASPEIVRKEGYRAGDPETFARDILEVKVESESRAVATATVKNTSPVPAGAEVSAYDTQRRRDGERVRYVLEREASRWRVAEIWQWNEYPSPGRWRKSHPHDDRPAVPSMIYQGL